MPFDMMQRTFVHQYISVSCPGSYPIADRDIQQSAFLGNRLRTSTPVDRRQTSVQDALLCYLGKPIREDAEDVRP